MARSLVHVLIVAAGLVSSGWTVPAFAGDAAVAAIPDESSGSAAASSAAAPNTVSANTAVAVAVDKPARGSAAAEKRSHKGGHRTDRRRPARSLAHRHRFPARLAFRLPRVDVGFRGCHSLGCAGYTIVGIGF
jgi:hypothetical protein